MTSLLTFEFVHEALDYCAETGIFVWKVRPRNHFKEEKGWNRWNGRYSGKIAGCLATNNYFQISIHKRFYQAHRLAWFFSYGEWPPAHIDHINGIKHDNRLANLRKATHSENCMNTGLRKSNTSGVKGVFWRKDDQRWGACIGINGKNLHLGIFDTIEEAETCVKAARSLHHGAFAHHG